MSRAPSLFVSHGSPMFALEPGLLGPNLEALGRGLDALQAIVVVSPHWQTRGVRVTGTDAPETIHDFGGFPPPLYALQYTPPDAVARRDTEALVDYRARAPFAARAHPTEEHYLPLLVALGASRADEPGELVRGGMTYEVLSMDSFGFGMPRA